MFSALQQHEAISRFGCRKYASFGQILPAVAAPILGGLLGRTLGVKLTPNKPQVGEVLGMIGGTAAGKYLSEDVFAPRQPMYAPQQAPETPPGAPYQLDPSSEDIPPWALAGARFLNPAMKMGTAWDSIRSGLHDAKDTILGEIPGYSIYEGSREGRGIPGAIKGTLGQAAGGVAGGTLGLGTGLLLKHLLGRDVNVPLANIPLSHFLAGVGGTIGATKGFRGSIGNTH